jgi:hypothetical protein
MARYLRTLLLIGLTGGLGALSGCIVESSGSSGSCAAGQFITVQWLLDNGAGTAPLTCAAAPLTSVELTMASGGPPLVVSGGCNDTYHYNWYGETPLGVVIPAGDYVTAFRLLRSDTLAELAPGGTFAGPSAVNPAVPACQSVALTFEFQVSM